MTCNARYHRCMKFLPVLGLFITFASASSQTTAPARRTQAHKLNSAPCNSDIPMTSQTVPTVPGCAQTLYALKYIDISIGTGPLAQPMQLYTVNYTGYLSDGSKFESSVDRKQPIIFPAGLHRVMVGLETGFEGMHVGGKRRLFIPYELGYGDEGKPPRVPGKAFMIFDVELMKQEDLPAQIPASHPSPSSPSATPKS